MESVNKGLSGHIPPSWVWSGRVPCLDGLRAVSILLVILSHVVENGFNGAWSLGPVGVTSFFVISGFLITLLLLRERRKTGNISIPGFYQRRALRILPAYAALMGGIFILQVTGWYTIPGSSWIRALTYTSCFSLLSMATVLAHTWSLSVEEHFYLLWPVLFKYCRPRQAVVLLSAYIALAPLVRWWILRENISWFSIRTIPRRESNGQRRGWLFAGLCRDQRDGAIVWISRHSGYRPLAGFEGAARQS